METRRIQILPPETAKRIAAGEVIEKPQSVLRELLDNAIDAGADDIAVDLVEGGISFMQVVDNGCGMDKDDITLSIYPHATSKIAELDDLLCLHTLGFRGEALSSIAAVANIEILSATGDDGAWRLESVPGREVRVMPDKGRRGTTVRVSDLFASFPARRQFLKRAASEALACRQTCVDKAMAFPEIRFRLTLDGKPSLLLLPGSLKDRVCAAAVPDQNPEFFRELVAGGNGFSARIIAGSASMHRKDRRHVQVFVNKRRVYEFAVQQALEYAYRLILPGGSLPYAYAFVEVDPALADFNIHPAKKEVRLRNVDEIRSGISRSLRDYFGNSQKLAFASALSKTQELFSGASSPVSAGRPEQIRSSAATAMPEPGYPAGESRFSLGERTATDYGAWVRKVREAGESGGAGAIAGQAGIRQETGGLRYLGPALGTFLVFEYANELVIMDQHAAHERILFDELCSSPPVREELLVPFVYEPESDEEDRYIEKSLGILAESGFSMEREGSAWMLTGVPSMMKSGGAGTIFSLLKSKPDPAALLHGLRAGIACKAAVKDGQELEPGAAEALARRALLLPEARCPHGRPIWIRMSREELFTAVGRTV